MFESAKLKIERADHHINDLETQFTAFVNSHPYAIAVGHDPQSGQTILRINFRQPIPKAWALIIGDAIHNLHTALDHMTWELIGRDGGKQNRHVKFPTGDSRASFEGTCNGIETPSQSVKDILKALEAFPGGKGNGLHALHHLDIADKHAILVPVVRAATVSKYVIFGPSNRPQSTWTDTRFIVEGDTGHINIAGVPPGGYVEFENDTVVTPDIVLPNPLGGFIPILKLLRNLRTEAAQALDAVENSIR